MVQMNLFAKQEKRHRCREEMYEFLHTKEELGGVKNWEIRIDTYTVLIFCSLSLSFSPLHQFA